MQLYRKPKSKFYWFDFTIRGHRYRGSTQETKAVKASNMAGLKLAQAIECTDQLPNGPTSFGRILTAILHLGGGCQTGD